MIYGCSQPRELWFIDFNHVYVHVHMKVRVNWNTQLPVSEVAQHDGGHLLWTHPHQPEKRPHPLISREGIGE